MMDPYSNQDPFLNTSFNTNTDTSSVIKCRNSAFLLSMKSPSLQTFPRTIKINPPPPPRPDPKQPASGSNSLEVSRLRSLIFSEDKESEYQRILQAKNQQIQALKAELRKKLNISQISNQENKHVSRSEAHEEALALMKQSLRYAVERCQTTYKTFQQRNAQFLELVAIMESMRKNGARESDFLQLKALCFSFSSQVQGNNEQAIELAESLKLLQEKNIENVQLSSRLEKLMSRCEYFQQRLQESNTRNSLFSEELKSRNKDLHQEENKSTEQGKRLFVLNKLVKALKSKGNRQEDQNNYKTVINELVKEIEGLKRVIVNKDKEIVHLREINEKLKAKLAGFAKRLEILQMNLSQKREDDDPLRERSLDYENQQFSLLTENRIPPMLDYRAAHLTAFMTNLFMDIENQGSSALLSYLREESSSPEDRVSVVSSLALQYSSYREFSESLNSLLFHLSRMISIGTMEELLAYFAMSFTKVFRCQQTRIWLDDRMTGIIESCDEKGVRVISMGGRGLIGKTLENLQPINKIGEKGQFLCEQFVESELKKSYVDGVLLVPFENRGLLEFSGFPGGLDRTKTLDCEYLAIVTRVVIGNIVMRLRESARKEKRHKLEEFYQMALVDLCSSESDFMFSERSKQWACRLFNVSISNFYFCTETHLIRHVSSGVIEELQRIGVAGKCSENIKPLLMGNLKNSPYYDAKVDLCTLMTVLTFPIAEKDGKEGKKCLAVVQIPIKESNMSRNAEFGEIREDFEKLATFFGEIVQLAMKYYRRTW